MTSRDLDSVLRAVLSSPMTTEQRVALDERLRVARTVPPVDSAGPTAWRPSARRLSLLAAAALLVLGSGVAAALVLTESPRGLSSSAMFQAEIDAAKAAVPIPRDASWPSSLAAQEGSFYSTGGARTWVEFVAFCLWTDSWLQATSTGNELAAASAATTLATVPSWEGYRSEFVDESVRVSLSGVIAAVAAGDVDPVAEYWDLNCAS